MSAELRHLKDLPSLVRAATRPVLPLPPHFRPEKDYYLLRHGQSPANVTGEFATPERALSDIGLTDVGRSQVAEGIRKIAEEILGKRLLIVSSDYRRAIESASIVAEELKVKEIWLTDALRERRLGQLETSEPSGVPYQGIARFDEGHPDNSRFSDGVREWEGLESPNQVAARVRLLIHQIEATFTPQTVLLVGHGATFGILEAVSQGFTPDQHGQVRRLKNGEARRLSFALQIPRQ